MKHENDIRELANLRFFSENGHEIFMEKRYALKWQIVSSVLEFHMMPSGYLIGNI